MNNCQKKDKPRQFIQCIVQLDAADKAADAFWANGIRRVDDIEFMTKEDMLGMLTIDSLGSIVSILCQCKYRSGVSLL